LLKALSKRKDAIKEMKKKSFDFYEFHYEHFEQEFVSFLSKT